MNINAHVWHDERLRKLSKESVIAYMYLLTSPHSNMAGFYVLPLEYMAYDLNWTLKTCNEALSELESHWLIKHDDHKKVVLILDHMKHNPVGGPTHLKCIINILKEIPSTSLMADFYVILKSFMTEQTEKFLEDIRSMIPENKTKAVKKTKGRK